MPGDEMQAQQKRTTGPRRNEGSPLTFEMGDVSPRLSEEDVLAEDDPLASNPPRPSSSAIRLNNPTNLTGSRRAINTTTQQTQQTPRASTAIPPRRNGLGIAPLPASTTARPTRTVTTPQSPPEPE